MKTSLKKTVSLLVILCFSLGNPLYPSGLQANPYLSPSTTGPKELTLTSPAHRPWVLKGIKLYPDDPLKFDFILEEGDNKISDGQLKKEAQLLIKYFLAALTLPEEDLWVNLSPFEEERIIPEETSQTDLGKGLLEQDYLLKKLVSSLTYPDTDLGERFWQKVYEQAYQRFGSSKLPFNTFNKVWIVPDKAVVYEDGERALIMESSLKVMLEQDYLALKNSQQSKVNSAEKKAQRDKISDKGKEELNNLTSQVMREVVIPAIEEEVNKGTNFASLRQMYSSFILASWFKQSLRHSLLSQVYVDKRKIKGIDLDEGGFKERIYQQYLNSYKQGLYNYIKSDYSPQERKRIKRRYWSGGAVLGFKVNGVPPLQRITFLDITDMVPQKGATAITSFAGVGENGLPVRDIGVLRAGSPLEEKEPNQDKDKTPIDETIILRNGRQIPRSFVPITMLTLDELEKKNPQAYRALLRKINEPDYKLPPIIETYLKVEHNNFILRESGKVQDWIEDIIKSSFVGEGLTGKRVFPVEDPDLERQLKKDIADLKALMEISKIRKEPIEPPESDSGLATDIKVNYDLTTGIEIVELKNGKNEPLPIVVTVMQTLKGLLEKPKEEEMKDEETKKKELRKLWKRLTTFYEAVMKARNPEHKIFTSEIKEELKNLALLQEDGTMHLSVRNVIVSAVEGEGIKLRLVNPIKGADSPLAKEYPDSRKELDPKTPEITLSYDDILEIDSMLRKRFGVPVPSFYTRGGDRREDAPRYVSPTSIDGAEGQSGVKLWFKLLQEGAKEKVPSDENQAKAFLKAVLISTIFKVKEKLTDEESRLLQEYLLKPHSERNMVTLHLVSTIAKRPREEQKYVQQKILDPAVSLMDGKASSALSPAGGIEFPQALNIQRQGPGVRNYSPEVLTALPADFAGLRIGELIIERR